MSDFQIVPYTRELLGDVEALFRSHLPGEEIERRLRLFEWFNAGNPRISEETPRYWLLLEGNRTVGRLGLARWPFALHGRRAEVLFQYDIMVSADVRGRGGALLLLEGTLAGRNEMTALLWINDAGRRLHLKSGATHLEFFPYAKIYDPGARLGTRFGALSPVVRTVARIVLGVRERLRTKASTAGYRFESIERFGPEFDEFFDSLSECFDAIAVRDSAYLNWKFVEKPFSNYRRIAARRADGALAGYIVFRTIEQQGEQHAVLLDFLADPAGPAFPALVEHALESLRPGRPLTVRIACTEPRMAEQLCGLGFRQEREPLHLGINNWQGQLDEAWATSTRHWYVTYSDGDGDAWT